MLGQILAILADCNNNIIDMINKSRDDIAYNLIDIAAKPEDEVLEKIRAIDGIINVRLVGI